MEIIDICGPDSSEDEGEEYPSTTRIKKKLGLDYVEYLVKSIELAVKREQLDFNKLK